MVKKATAIIQARMSSTRLPHKVMLPLCGKSVIDHIISRLKMCKALDEIILATSISTDDDVLESVAIKNNIDCYRGSLEDVLARFYFAAQNHQSNHIVRVCADSPLLDMNIIDNAVTFYLTSYADIVKTVNMPLGLGTEVFSFSALERAYINAKEQYQREHVTPYMIENSKYNVLEIKPDYSRYRLTLDTEEDFTVIEKIYNELYIKKHEFYLQDIVSFLEENPDIMRINGNIQQKQVH